jgi:hypothetical protein
MKFEIKFPEWFNMMTLKNRMLWGHILGGGLLCKMGLWIHIPKWWMILIVFILACLWEVIEWMAYNGKIKNVYGSYKRWILDCLGDILGAVCCALLIVL